MAVFDELTIAREEATITYRTATLKVGYNPERINQAFLNRMRAYGEQMQQGVITDDDARKKLAEMVMELLLDWDVTEADEKTPKPLNEESLRQTALRFQVHLIQSIVNMDTSKNHQGTDSQKRSRRSTSRKAK